MALFRFGLSDVLMLVRVGRDVHGAWPMVVECVKADETAEDVIWCSHLLIEPDQIWDMEQDDED